MEPYSEKVLSHFKDPQNVGLLEDGDISAESQVGNPQCGDIMKLQLKIGDNDIIEDIKFQTFGCGAAIATSSMATELIKGKTIAEASNLTKDAVAKALDGLPPVKMHCSVLAVEAVEAALDDYKDKQDIQSYESQGSTCCSSGCGEGCRG